MQGHAGTGDLPGSTEQGGRGHPGGDTSPWKAELKNESGVYEGHHWEIQLCVFDVCCIEKENKYLVISHK